MNVVEELRKAQHVLDCAIDDVSGTVTVEVERIIENLEAMVDAYEHREVREAIDDLRKLVDDFQDPPRGNQ